MSCLSERGVRVSYGGVDPGADSRYGRKFHFQEADDACLLLTST